MDDYGKKPNRGSEPERWGEDPNRPSWQRQDTPGSSPSTQRPSQDPWSNAAYQQVYPPSPTDGPRGPYRPPGGGRVSERKARLTLTLFFVSFGVLMIGVVVFLTVRNLRAGGDNPVSGSTEDARTLGIGPPPGVELGTYVETRKAALAQLSDDRVAVVSLADYTTEADARALAGGAEVLALLAAAPGGQPSLVTGDVASWVDSQTAEARTEREEIQKLIPTVKDDPEFQSFYRDEIDRLTQLISSIQPDSDLIFALVVRAPAPVLQELGNNPEVRLVDIGPTADPGPTPRYRGLRPEETEKANEPNTRPEA